MKKRAKQKTPLKTNLSKKNFSDILLGIFIFLLPTQLGRHFFFGFSYVFGIRVDYLAPTFYALDALAIILIFLHRRVLVKSLNNKWILALLLAIAVNTLFSTVLPISFYWFLRVVELAAILTIFKQTKMSPTFIVWGFFAGALLQTALVVLQLMNKESIQGIFYLFGERYFTSETPGIAKAALQGSEILRPYGTFSHPNSLGGFYALVYTFFLFTARIYTPRIIKNILLALSTFLIFFSFSKGVIATFIFINILYLVINRKKLDCTICLFAKIFILAILTAIFTSATTDAQSLNKRIELSQFALSLFLQYPLLGSGVGTFVAAAKDFATKFPHGANQPVHNIFLLLLSELGILGSGILSYIMSQRIWRRRKNTSFIACFSVVILTGMVDHYWLSLIQNFLLMGVVFGLVINPQYRA